jgi:hypothetical protein
MKLRIAATKIEGVRIRGKAGIRERTESDDLRTRAAEGVKIVLIVKRKRAVSRDGNSDQ